DRTVYDGVRPNDDGDKDYLEIHDIRKYAENRGVIFNRWGTNDYELTNYDCSKNVFRGYSDDSATLERGILRTGTYFYVLEYTKTVNGSSKKIKRSGHLYLKTD